MAYLHVIKDAKGRPALAASTKGFQSVFQGRGQAPKISTWLDDDNAIAGGIVAPTKFMRGLSRLYQEFGIFEELLAFYQKVVTGGILHPEMQFGVMEVTARSLNIMLVSPAQVIHHTQPLNELGDLLPNLRMTYNAISTIPAT